MANVCDVIEIMERWAPSGLAEDWDNVGLMTGSPDDEVRSVVIALDVTGETIALAIKHGATLIVSHHPPLFRPLKTLAGNDRASEVIRMAVTENIALYASHTNLDQAPDGVSHALAGKLGLSDIRPLAQGNGELIKFVTFCPPDYTDKIRSAAGQAGAGVIGKYTHCSFTSPGTGTYIPSEDASPYKGTHGELSHEDEDRIEMVVPAVFVPEVIAQVKAVHPFEEMAYDIIPVTAKEPSFGYGAAGNLNAPMTLTDFIGHVCRSLDIETVTYSSGAKKEISRVAVMGGSGADNISSAVRDCADAYITGEIGHHDYMEYYDTIALVDATHRATELPVLAKIKAHLESSAALDGISCIIDSGTAVNQTYKVN
ncbi:Nif3-like dinuclear metal center hexameric protein [Candidatus Latescibacterota bacterium]